MSFKLEDYIDYHTLCMTMCIVVAYNYITQDTKPFLIKK